LYDCKFALPGSLLMVFSRLFTRSPLDDPREKAWTELRMQWLSEQFGVDALLNAEVLTPTPECFPEPYGGTLEDAERLMRRLCLHYGLNAARIRLSLHEPEEMPNATGTYEVDDAGATLIRLARTQLLNHDSLLATLAHELAHVRLLGERRLAFETPDHEFVTDLLPVYFGAGVFNANATVRDRTEVDGTWVRWQIERQGYLPSRMYGYAFALFGWVRGEEAPEWAGHLRKDARDVFHTAMRYLRKCEDSLFTRETAGRPTDPPPTADLIEDLRTGTPSRQIAALWRLREDHRHPAGAVPAVLRAARSKSPMISATALETLAAIAEPNAEFESAVRPLLRHAHPAVRSTAIRAVLRLSPRLEEAVQDFAACLNDPNLTVTCWAAHALAGCGRAAMAAEPELLAVLKRSVVKHHHELTELCVAALCAGHEDEDVVRSVVRDAFPDPEIHNQAIDVLRELRESAARPEPPDPFIMGNRPGTARLH
jgi:hypothetical protein